MTIGIFIGQLLLVVILGTYGTIIDNSHINWYLENDKGKFWYSWIIIPLRFLLLLSMMIPISLKVSIDVCFRLSRNKGKRLYCKSPEIIFYAATLGVIPG
uniref:Uncharacterized protein n=1 Tax=Arcella intermedia TaxID=1963864 RepID=A0A6B2LUB5_9EUKA